MGRTTLPRLPDQELPAGLQASSPLTLRFCQRLQWPAALVLLELPQVPVLTLPQLALQPADPPLTLREAPQLQLGLLL